MRTLTAISAAGMLLVGSLTCLSALAQMGAAKEMAKGAGSMLTDEGTVPNQHTEMQQRKLEIYQNKEAYGTPTYQPPPPKKGSAGSAN
ncbi:hypothetical protein [Burkholderia ubonensis]|uniref:hypothetical protein n=1 Tax=Burkholderia ubonensis TaxID=101571 RepID=UPI0018DF4111|nr:hypothetical protein [Burkholderia ubonensis]